MDNEMKGSKTDIAFLEFLKKAGINLHSKKESYEIIKKHPFTSLRKRMSVIIKTQNTGKPHRLLIKGFPFVNQARVKWFLKMQHISILSMVKYIQLMNQ